MIGTFCATLCDVASGVPQSSLLGPLKLIVKINDIKNNMNSTGLGYADDCIFISTNNEMFQDDIIQEQKWCDKNQMSQNLINVIY